MTDESKDRIRQAIHGEEECAGRIDTALELLEEEFGTFILASKLADGNIAIALSRVDEAFCKTVVAQLTVAIEKGQYR